MSKLLILCSLFLSLSCSAATIKLTEKNHHFLNSQVDEFSMAIALADLQRMDKELPKGEPLYLVLKTPGGSVIDGMEFIRAVKHLSRPVTTITIYSMSMGFQIVEALGERLIVSDGIMMTHPIAGTCKGRIPDIKSCLDFMSSLAVNLDRQVAKRMSLPLLEYQRLSSDEWFEIGQDAVQKNMSDRVVRIECSKEMNLIDRCPY